MEHKILLEQFYEILSIESTEPFVWKITVRLNPEHAVYEGHFPGEPVTPGVCMLQIIKECLSGLLNKSLHYKRLGTCKFLSVVNPQQNSVLQFSLSVSEQEDNTFQLAAEGITGEIPFLKLKGTLSVGEK